MQRLRNLLLISTALIPLATGASAGPTGGTVVGGSATISNPGTANVTINQQSDKAIINWTLFNIGAGEKTTFNQPGVNSITLNKVTGGMGPSEILGTLTANGKVFIVNRDGIIFGPGAVITTSGFLATTSDIKNEDFMAGRFNFSIPGRPDASIVNMGTITATNGGFAALVAPGVRNTGTITADLGTIGLAAGNAFSLDFYGDRLITLGVGDQIATQVKDVATGQTLKSLVTNEGKLKANGGRVELTAASARVVVDSVINTSGVIEANSVGTKNGQIVLSAATGAPPSSSTRGQTAVAATNPPQKIKVSGTLSASGKEKGTKGGSIVVSGEHIELAGAAIDASGSAGGGKVMIGGDWGGGNPNTSAVSHPMAVLEAYAIPNATTVSVDAATKIDASAKDGGNGGKVIVWANDQLTFAGTILALGGREFGNGGFIETSARSVDVTGTISAGKGGLWLLDPDDLTIGAPQAATISSTLNGGTDVTQSTSSSGTGGNGDIFVTAQIAWNSAATLTLSAYHNIQINGIGVPGTIKNTGAGNLILHANNEGAFAVGSGDGIINMPPSTFSNRVDWTGSTGKVTVYYNPTSYTSPTDFTVGNGSFVLASPNQLTAYMLVNTETNLQNINTNPNGNYALGKDIDASSIPNFTAMGTYNGKLDGLGHTISNLTIAPVTPISVGAGYGMFAAVGVNGSVSNLNFDKASITANPNASGPGQFIGVLAGTNAGTITNVNVTNSTVSGGTKIGIIAGGLVGQNGDLGNNQLGKIINSSSAATVSVASSNNNSSNNIAGGLVGSNPGTITDSSATGTVSGGAYTFVGGLVGTNNGTINGTFVNGLSFATGNVSVSDGTGAGAGGLVGFNFGTINNSFASGNVTGGNSSDIFKGGGIGGLVGFNQGGSITGGFAFGDVSAGTNSSAGGLVGFNTSGTITASAAGGAVSSVDNFAGGLVGFNGLGGVITSSTAVGAVTGGGFGVGGLVGDNSGTIVGSVAGGNVTSTAPIGPSHDGDAGGFAGNNTGSISGSFASGNVSGHNSAGGFVGSNGSLGGSITNSFASGNVTVTDGGTAGGFVSGNHGIITNSQALGNVTGSAQTVLGGFAAGNLDGTISDSTASGAVKSTGTNSIVGGFAGVNTANLIRVTSSGAVSGTSESFLGGLVGINLGLVQDSTSSSSVTGSGSHNIAGGLAGVNFGSIDPSRSSGNVSSGPDSIVGGFVGANAAIQLTDGTKVVGTISPDSSATGNASGGTGSTVGAQVGQTFPTSGFPQLPQPVCDNGGGEFCGGRLFDPNATQPAQPQPQPQDKNVAQVAPLINITETLLTDPLTEKKQDDVVPTGGGGQGGQGGQSGGPTGQKGNKQGDQSGARPQLGFAPYGLGPLPSGMPPLNETRFLDDVVAFQIGGDLSDDDFAALVRRLKLTILYQERIGLLGRRVVTFKLAPGQTVRGIIPQLQALGSHFSAQPVYQFQMVQNVVQAPSPADTQRKGDSAQYIVEKLGLTEAHLIATGKDVKVAVIDSEIDARHPDLEGAVTANYDALPSDDQTAHPHGTGMAGAIASHQRLLGVAPGAKLLAVRAFGVNTGGAQGTSMNIVKGLQWAVDQGAKVINMSFAGPRDPILQQAMQRLTDQGIILIAAAGNAGPKSAPLYPGADPNVIAVSATDVDDKTYKNANRGKYVAIAAPGVDILVPAPEGGYQLTTGTSVAAAHISGVVALMLERNKALKPAEVRAILTATAKKTGAAPAEVGAGLVDPVHALAKSGPKQAKLH